MHTYQTKHPGMGRKFTVHDEIKLEDMKGKELKLTKENYGLLAYENFSKDVDDDKMLQGMLQAYLTCHAINFQLWGRQSQSKWFAKRAEEYKGKIARLFKEIADAYHDEVKELKEFVETNEKNKEDGKLYSRIRKSQDDLKKAYKHEQRAVEAITKLVKELQKPESLEDSIKEALFMAIAGGDAHVDPLTVIADLKEDKLPEKVADDVMTLGKQLTHLHFWQLLIVQNIKEGKPSWDNIDSTINPPNYLEKYNDWDGFKKAIMDSIIEIQQMVLDANNLTQRFPELNDASVAHLIGVYCSHMSYHLAQVVIIRKFFGLWPPLGYYTPY